jgi:hypothetical protein
MQPELQILFFFELLENIVHVPNWSIHKSNSKNNDSDKSVKKQLLLCGGGSETTKRPHSSTIIFYKTEKREKFGIYFFYSFLNSREKKNT